MVLRLNEDLGAKDVYKRQAYVRGEQRVVLALDGPIPPIVEDVSHHLLNMNGVFVIEARLDGIVHIVLREIGYLVPDLLLGPIRVLLFIEAGQVLLLHRLLVDGRFEIDLETQNVRICNGLANGVRMQQLAEDFLRAKTSAVSRFYSIIKSYCVINSSHYVVSMRSTVSYTHLVRREWFTDL